MIVDSHVHFWDPAILHYPWLSEFQPLRRAYAPAEYESTGAMHVERIVVVEANCAPEQHLREVEYLAQLGAMEPRITAIVAFAEVTCPHRLVDALRAFETYPLVRGVRRNIQRESPGFCLKRSFVEGVRMVGQRGYSFDLCVTHDQLADTVSLVRACPETTFVLDHCGKPTIDGRSFKSWVNDIGQLARCDNVYCKLSGLLTEADTAHRRNEDLRPYAMAVVDCFGPDRLMYGTDWPVVTLAGSQRCWCEFLLDLTADWSAGARDRFYGGTAAEVYRLAPATPDRD